MGHGDLGAGGRQHHRVAHRDDPPGARAHDLDHVRRGGGSPRKPPSARQRAPRGRRPRARRRHLSRQDRHAHRGGDHLRRCHRAHRDDRLAGDTRLVRAGTRGQRDRTDSAGAVRRRAGAGRLRDDRVLVGTQVERRVVLGCRGDVGARCPRDDLRCGGDGCRRPARSDRHRARRVGAPDARSGVRPGIPHRSRCGGRAPAGGASARGGADLPREGARGRRADARLLSGAERRYPGDLGGQPAHRRRDRP